MNLNPKVSVIVLNWNTRDMTIRCVQSLERSSYSSLEIILVDNGSTDGSAEAFRERFPHHVVIETGANLGYAGGNAVGMRYAIEHHADFVCIVNSDVQVEPSSIQLIMDAVTRHGPRYLYSPKVLLSETSGVYYEGLCLDSLTGAIVPGGQGCGSGDLECDFAQGSCLLVSKDIISTYGFLREDFFLYYEDFEYCLRLKRAGVRSICVSGSVVRHLGNASSQDVVAREYYRARNNIVMLKLNLSKSTYVAYLFFLLLRKGRQLLLLRNNHLVRRAVIRGVLDGISGTLGRYQPTLPARP